MRPIMSGSSNHVAGICRAAALALLAGVSTTPVHAQSLHAIPRDGSGRLPTVQAVSLDGNTVVGFAGFPGGRQAFVWSAAIGYSEINGMPTGTLRSDAMGVSADGNVIIGNFYRTADKGIYRYDRNGVTEIHGTPLEDRVLPNCLAADGVWFAGSWSLTNSAQWGGCFLSNGNVGEFFAPVGEARGLSADGTTVVGYHVPGGPGTQGTYHWRFGTLTALPMDEPSGVSADGNTVVGPQVEIFSPSDFILRAIRWHGPLSGGPAGTVQLTIAGATVTAPKAISADGQTWGGFCSFIDGSSFAWINSGGVTSSLWTYLQTRGVDVTGWSFGELNCISMDGQVLAGSASHNGQSVAFVADLRKDTDGDGLFDDWETNGIPYLYHGQVARYMLPDANPLKKDVYVEVDGTAGQVSLAAVERVVQVFNNAPVPAVPDVPGALPGVALHVDIDEGDLQIDGNFTINRGWEEFHAVKGVYFGTYQERQQFDWESIRKAKAKAFRYCLCVNRLPGALGRAELIDNGTDGAREATNDFMIGLGGFNPPPGRSIEDARAAAFMHELGHTLGLFHGGADASQNFNPNHYSIMNYLWAGVRNYGGTASLLLNYSDCQPPALTESFLDESLGIQHPHSYTVPVVMRASITESPCFDPPTNHGRCFRTNEQNVLYTCLNHVPSQGKVDWNNDRAIAPFGATVCADPNGLLSRSSGETLASVNEWELLAYNFRDSQYFDDAALPVSEHPCPSEPVEMFLTTLEPAGPTCFGVAPSLTIPDPPAATGCTAQVVEFTASSANEEPFELRWQWFDAAAMPPAWRDLQDGYLPGNTVIYGANSWVLKIENPQVEAFGSATVQFSCRATDLCGMFASSPPCVLTIGELTFAPTSPARVVTCPGGSASFSISASSNAGPVEYQWQFAFSSSSDPLVDGVLPHGTVVNGARTPTLTLTNVQPEDFLSYPLYLVSCALTNSCGTVFTDWFTFSSTGVMIFGQPGDIEGGCTPSSDAVFSVDALGAGPMNYRWHRNGIALSDGGRIFGTRAPTLTLSPPLATDGGIYTCLVSTSCSSEASQPAKLNLGAPGILTDPPVFVPVCINETADMPVVAYGAEPLTYQWMKDGVDLTDSDHYIGTRSSYLGIYNVGPSDLTSYSLRITNACGTFVSQPGTLTLAQPIQFASHPLSQTACPGAQTVLSVATVTDKPSLLYFWEIEDPQSAGNYVPVPGPLGSGASSCAYAHGQSTRQLTLTWNAACANQFRFRCAVFNGCEFFQSNVAAVTMCRPDIDCSGSVGVSDIFAYLSAWFAGSPAADFDHSGVVNVQDIFNFLSTWFAGC